MGDSPPVPSSLPHSYTRHNQILSSGFYHYIEKQTHNSYLLQNIYMRSLLFSMMFCVSLHSFAQLNIGLKAGLNFANVTKASEVNADTRTGYMLGGYISPKAGKTIGFRS